VRNTPTSSFIFGSVPSAFRYAENLWRGLPRPTGPKAEALTKDFRAAFSGVLPPGLDLTELTLRRPHCAACFIGIFGGGTTGFPGEFALASGGVLLFADVERFKPEIIAELLNRLRTAPADGSPIVLIHSTQAVGVPASLAPLSLPRVDLD
jgi:hypothetical protein